MGDGKRALRYLGLAPEAQLTEMDFANAIHACAASSAQGNSGGGGARGGALLVQEAVGALRRLQGLATARAGCVAGCDCLRDACASSHVMPPRFAW